LNPFLRKLLFSEKKAIEIMVRATKPQGRTFNVDYRDDKTPTQIRLFKSVKLWQHYIDLEEALGTFASTKAVYDRVLELKIVTPQIIINYGLFLQLHKYFEESFKVYERGIDLFGYPISFEIWNVYLPKFIARYVRKRWIITSIF
jgi:pre-mRNA-splicing factor SYF1